MQRRTFVKNALCLGCMGILASGCKNIPKDATLRQDKFFYKSKADLPKKIRLEACSLCQLNCPACAVRKLETNMDKDWLGYLKFDDFKNFVDDNDFEEIELSNNGEIFLNPELDEIIEYAYHKGIRLSAGNGVNFNSVSDMTLENLVKFKFKYLAIAIDGATAETYKIYRRGGDFNKVVDNIKRINYFKEKYNSEFPRLTYQFIVFGHNEHEIELAKEKANELNMGLKFKRNDALEYSPIKNKKLVEKQTGLKIIENKNKLLKIELEIHNNLNCYEFFHIPQIDYNGDLLGCCHVYDFDFGVNVFEKGLLNALNSKNVIYAKHMLTDLSTPPKKEIPCTDCSTYKFLRRQNKTFSINQFSYSKV